MLTIDSHQNLPLILSDYDKYAPALYGIILKVEHDPGKASGILLELFTHAPLKRVSFDAEKQTSFTWLLNSCMELLRDRYPSTDPDVRNLIAHNKTPRKMLSVIHSFPTIAIG